MAQLFNKIKIINNVDANGLPIDGSLITEGGAYISKNLIANGITSVNDINTSKNVYLNKLKSFNNASIEIDPILTTEIKTDVIKLKENNNLIIKDNDNTTLLQITNNAFNSNVAINAININQPSQSIDNLTILNIKAKDDEKGIKILANDDTEILDIKKQAIKTTTPLVLNNNLTSDNLNININKPVNLNSNSLTTTSNIYATDGIYTGNIECKNIGSQSLNVIEDIACRNITSDNLVSNTSSALITSSTATTGIIDVLNCYAPNAIVHGSTKIRLGVGLGSDANNSYFVHNRSGNNNSKGFSIRSCGIEAMNYVSNASSTTAIHQMSIFPALTCSNGISTSTLSCSSSASILNDLTIGAFNLNSQAVTLIGKAYPCFRLQNHLAIPTKWELILNSVSSVFSLFDNSSVGTTGYGWSVQSGRDGTFARNMSIGDGAPHATYRLKVLQSSGNDGIISSGNNNFGPTSVTNLISSGSVSILGSASIGSTLNCNTINAGTASINGNLSCGNLTSSGITCNGSLNLGNNNINLNSISSFNGSSVNIPSITNSTMLCKNFQSSDNTFIGFGPNNNTARLLIDLTNNKLESRCPIDALTHSISAGSISCGSMVSNGSMSCNSLSVNGVVVNTSNFNNIPTNDISNFINTGYITCNNASQSSLFKTIQCNEIKANDNANILVNSQIDMQENSIVVNDIFALNSLTLNTPLTKILGNLECNEIKASNIKIPSSGILYVKNNNNDNVIVIDNNTTEFKNQTLIANTMQAGNGSFDNLDASQIKLRNNSQGLYITTTDKLTDLYNFNDQKFTSFKDIECKTKIISKNIDSGTNALLISDSVKNNILSINNASIIANSDIDCKNNIITNALLTNSISIGTANTNAAFSITKKDVTAQYINNTRGINMGVGFDNNSYIQINSGLTASGGKSSAIYFDYAMSDNADYDIRYRINSSNSNLMNVDGKDANTKINYNVLSDFTKDVSINTQLINDIYKAKTVAGIIFKDNLNNDIVNIKNNNLSCNNGKLSCSINEMKNISNNFNSIIEHTNLFYSGWFSANMLSNNFNFKNTSGITKYWHINYTIKINNNNAINTQYKSWLQKINNNQKYAEDYHHKLAYNDYFYIKGSSVIQMLNNEEIYLMVNFLESYNIPQSVFNLDGGEISIHEIA